MKGEAQAKRNNGRLLHNFMWILLAVGLFFVADNNIALSQDTIGSYGFRVEAVLDTLLADGESETTLIAFLGTNDGSGIDNERIRFVLEQGLATLSAPEPGQLEFSGLRRDVSNDRLEISEGLVSIDAINIGNGVYVGRLKAGKTAGIVSVSAQWITSPQSPVPTATVNIELINAGQLTVKVDDSDLLSDPEDSATIVAYVLDKLNKPIDNANITFRVTSGSGTVNHLDIGDDRAEPDAQQISGRYAAIYRPGQTPGETIIEVALPTITDPIRSEVRLNVVEASMLEAVAFPRIVARRIDSNLRVENTATILVAVRDGNRELVSGLTERQLEAQVVAGPGEIFGMEEVRLNNRGTGIYQYTFVATDTTGRTVVQITNLDSPRFSSVEIEIDVRANVSPSVIQKVDLAVFPNKLPFYADGVGNALIFAFAGDDVANAVRSQEDFETEFTLVSGRGQLDSQSEELTNPIVSGGTGIYITNFLPGNSSVRTITTVRAIFTTTNGHVVTEATNIELRAVDGPDVVVFPPAISADRGGRAVIDIFDATDSDIAINNSSRYRAEIESGPGRILGVPRNDGRDADLVTDDHLSSVMYEMFDSAGSSQDVRFSIVDQLIVGFPITVARLRIGDVTDLRGFASPQVGDPGSEVQIIAFAQDEFGLPALDHELTITVISGSAEELSNGRMIDNGGEIFGFRDAYADDGMYTGVIRTTGVASGTVRVRVIDVTPPEQPSTEFTIQIN